MKKALILHGTAGSPKNNWFSWLKQELEKQGYTVWLPQLPHAEKPDPKNYTPFLLSKPDFQIDADTIIIGHSSGAVEVLHLLQSLPGKFAIKAAILVSAFKDDLGWEALTALFTEPLDLERVKTRSKQFIFFHSDDDPYCPLEHAEYLSRQVGGELKIMPGQGHFNTEASPDYTAFPLLLTTIAALE
jgi:predicted alpha/beta hydrolase family esterase